MMRKLWFMAWFLWMIPAAFAQENPGSIGILFDFDPPGSPRVVIYSVTYKSPADKAKILRGDVLLKVDGADIQGKSLEQVAGMIRGAVGTPVVLTLERGGAPLEFNLTRAPLAQGPVVAVPPPSQMAQSVNSNPSSSSSRNFNDSEKTLVKQKILSLKTEDERQKMWQLLQDFKSEKISKSAFLQKLQTEFSQNAQ